MIRLLAGGRPKPLRRPATW